MKEAPYLGRIHPDTFQFSDMKTLQTLSSLPQMSQIDVYHDGRLVFGYEVIYQGPNAKQF